jgi:uncharacterized DUF497 family protein
MEHEEHPVNYEHLRAFIEAAGALVEDALITLNQEKRDQIVGHLDAGAGMLGLAMTLEPLQVRIVLQDKHGEVLSDIGTLTMVKEQPRIVN